MFWLGLGFADSQIKKKLDNEVVRALAASFAGLQWGHMKHHIGCGEQTS